MTRVIVIDLVGDDEAVKTERKVDSEPDGKSVVWQSPAPALGLVEVSFEHDSIESMPATYRVLLDVYFRK